MSIGGWQPALLGEPWGEMQPRGLHGQPLKYRRQQHRQGAPVDGNNSGNAQREVILKEAPRDGLIRFHSRSRLTQQVLHQSRGLQSAGADDDVLAMNAQRLSREGPPKHRADLRVAVLAAGLKPVNRCVVPARYAMRT